MSKLCEGDDGLCFEEAEADGFCDKHHPSVLPTPARKRYDNAFRLLKNEAIVYIAPIADRLCDAAFGFVEAWLLRDDLSSKEQEMRERFFKRVQPKKEKK